MPRGAITGYIDVAQVVLYAFWIFFAGLIFYLRREDKREGYPLESDRSGRVLVQGFPAMPAPKTFLLSDGTTRTVPNPRSDRQNVAVAPVAAWPGAPLVPTGNPMKDGVGPASYAKREDVPEHTHRGRSDHRADAGRCPISRSTRTIPTRAACRWSARTAGLAGTVKDVWVDRAETLIRYLEVEVAAGARRQRAAADDHGPCQPPAGAPSTWSRSWPSSSPTCPKIASPNQVTKLEEDRIVGYYAGGTLYATPARQEPLL